MSFPSPEAVEVDAHPDAYVVEVDTTDITVEVVERTGPPGTVGPFREGHTFAVLGDLTALVTLPSFFVPKNVDQTVRLAGVWAKTVAGTVGFQVKRNGANVGGVVPVSPTIAFSSLGDLPLADGDEITAVLSGHAGSPNTLSATVVLEWAVP